MGNESCRIIHGQRLGRELYGIDDGGDCMRYLMNGALSGDTMWRMCEYKYLEYFDERTILSRESLC